ncbi:acyltransferase family protein [Streptomyces sp. NPDC048448]|uniref:Acyltransferase family protein n=1 Tax=Streptomyces kaempferi TaxID=333725 RepID=A0ABW3XB97_9ACTN
MVRAAWPAESATQAPTSPPHDPGGGETAGGSGTGTPARSAAAAPLRLDIQGLRALAVSLVVLAHAGVRHVAGGYIGVDVFFVISGFLITSLLLRELVRDGRISVRRFYARRALRLLPASTVVGLATLCGAWLCLSKIRFEEYVGDALSSTLYVVNFRLANAGTDYLNADSPPSPFQHFWSLAVEEQFYLVWPLLLWAGWKLARRRTGLVAVPFAMLCVISFALNVRVTATSASWAYFGSHTRFWELGVGALLALFARRLERLPTWASGPMSWIGLVSLLVAAVRFDDNTPFPGYYALVPVLGVALVLAGGCSPARYGAGRLLSLRPAVWVGGLSYGWYLWHWPVLVILPMASDRPATAPFGLVCAAIALLLAWVTLHLVENPVRFHRVFRGRPVRALGLGAALTACAAAAALVATGFPPPIASDVAAPGLRSALTGAADPRARLTELLEGPHHSLPSNLTPGLTRIKGTLSQLYRDDCHIGYLSTATPPCVYGDRSASKVVVLFGDSHAAQWFPAVDRLAKEHHWKLVSMTKSSCKVSAVTTVYQGKPYVSCDQWRTKQLARIRSLHPALVIASSSDAADLARPSGDPRRQWTDGFKRTFRELVRSGAEVLAIVDTPWPKGDAVDCAGTHPRELERCASDVGDAVKDPGKKREITDAAAATGVSVIDPLPWLCGTGGCPVVVGDTFVYRDDSHLTESYAEALAPVLGREMTALYGADLTRHPGRVTESPAGR